MSENNFTSMNPAKSDLTIRFDGKTLALPLAASGNRYYIPLEGFISQIEGKIDQKDNTMYLLFKNHPAAYIDTQINDYKFALVNNKLSVSLFDLCRILNLKSRWDYEKNQISLFPNRDALKPKRNSNERMAFIRFEDITAEEMYLDSENLEKFRIIADYMYASGAPFHIAWIPRFLDPLRNIDNDLSQDFNMPNAHFLFTMEYLLNRNGTLGLHGYTHQYGEEVSGEGTEFSEDRNTDEKSIRERIEAAIRTANTLELPFAFFESPHYASTEFQQSIYEQYFNIIYEGCVGIWGDAIVKSPRNGRTLYIPTPLGYVEGENGLAEMLKRIEMLDENSLASLFYHPFAEFDYITIDNENNFNYSENSPLHLMVNALYDKECVLRKITELE